MGSEKKGRSVTWVAKGGQEKKGKSAVELSFAWSVMKGMAQTAVELISSSGDRPLSLRRWAILFLSRFGFFFFLWKWFEGKIDV